MPAGHGSRDVFVDTRFVGKEVIVDGEAACKRPTRGEPCLHVGGSRDCVPAGDLRCSRCPIGALAARLLVIGIGKARFIRDARILVAVHRWRHVPPAAAARAGRRTHAKEQRGFRQVDIHGRVVALNSIHGLDRGGRSKRNAGTAAALVSDGCDEVLAAHVTPIIGRGGCSNCCLDCRKLCLRRRNSLFQTFLTAARIVTEPAFLFVWRQLRNRRLCRGPSCIGALDQSVELIEIQIWGHRTLLLRDAGTKFLPSASSGRIAPAIPLFEGDHIEVI